MTKPKSSAPPSASGNAAPTDQPTFRTNPEVDAKIDSYIKDNPKYWAYVQAMPRERLERTVVLNEVRELDRQQRMREGLMKRINSNPARSRPHPRPAAVERRGCRRMKTPRPGLRFPMESEPGQIKELNPQSCVPA